MDANHLIPVIGFDDVVLTRGEGSAVFGQDGRRLVDLTSGQFCTVLGNGNAEVQDEIARKTASLVNTSTALISDEVLAAAERLHRISGEMRASSIILSTGAEVIEFCLRDAKFIKGKPGVICFENGYHGLTLGAQSVTMGGGYAVPRVSPVYPIPAPDRDWTSEQLDASLASLELLMQTSGDIAAMLIEPIVSVGGMVFPPASWLVAARALCDEYGILLVLDECQTGFGRTGDWFAYQKFGIVPDMVALAKAIGLGYPVAVAMFRDTVIAQAGRLPAHYSSHQNDPFGAAVVNTAIDYIERHDVLANVKKMGTIFLEALQEAAASSPHLVNPRGTGLMLGIDLSIPGIADYRPIYSTLVGRLLERGVIIQGTSGGSVLRFLPDYLISEDDIRESLRKVAEVVDETAASLQVG
ncbi:aspartate aminotransferase family protein [Gryllotalpicola reticulitermitis]|uniref:Aspartate aminotransferase family protein n=1 Tax=Gryllotalpicola reticulitermitis TaxID=1184153 RepID=A0ABV8Q7D2_9MICO